MARETCCIWVEVVARRCCIEGNKEKRRKQRETKETRGNEGNKEKRRKQGETRGKKVEALLVDCPVEVVCAKYERGLTCSMVRIRASSSSSSAVVAAVVEAVVAAVVVAVLSVAHRSCIVRCFCSSPRNSAANAAIAGEEGGGVRFLAGCVVVVVDVVDVVGVVDVVDAWWLFEWFCCLVGWGGVAFRALNTYLRWSSTNAILFLFSAEGCRVSSFSSFSSFPSFSSFSSFPSFFFVLELLLLVVLVVVVVVLSPSCSVRMVRHTSSSIVVGDL